MSESSRGTVLIADDEGKFRASLAGVLAQTGFDVVEATTGAEALGKAASLPDLDGVEVCRRIKADPLTAGVPVVMVSGVYTGSGERAEGLEGGADADLTKPVPGRELLATAPAILRARAAEEALRRSEARYRTLVDGSIQGICVQRDVRILFAHDACPRIFGYARAGELIGLDARRMTDRRLRFVDESKLRRPTSPGRPG